MPELQRLRAGHAPAVLAFELANRVYFAASVSDRGDEFYDRFTERHSALLAEQEAGIGAFYVFVAEDGSVLGRFNLYGFKDGTAVLGYRVAQHVAGRGVATAAVRELCGLAAAQYGLRTLRAATSRENAASQKVLTRAGFIPAGPADPADLGGKQGTWYQRDLVQPLSSSLLVRGYAVSRSCGLGEVLLPGAAFEDAWTGEGDGSDERIPLCRIEYLGDDEDWGFAVYDPARQRRPGTPAAWLGSAPQVAQIDSAAASRPARAAAGRARLCHARVCHVLS